MRALDRRSDHSISFQPGSTTFAPMNGSFLDSPPRHFIQPEISDGAIFVEDALVVNDSMMKVYDERVLHAKPSKTKERRDPNASCSTEGITKAIKKAPHGRSCLCLQWWAVMDSNHRPKD